MLLTRLKNILDEFGTANGLLYILGQALQRLTHGRAFLVRYHFFAQPVPSEPQSHVRPSIKSRVREASASDPIVASFPRPHEVIAQRFASGARCLVAEQEGRFAGFIWLARGFYEEDEIRCRYELVPSDSCAWDFDVYVVPTYRNGRTFARLWDAANALLAKEGINWSLSRISAFNVTSLAAHQRLGIKKICSAVFLRIGALQISIAPKKIALHLGGRPTLKLLAPRA